MPFYDSTFDLAAAAANETSFSLENSTLLRNFSEEEVMKVHFYYGLLIDRLVTPFWYVIGLIGNTISVAVWLKHRMRKNCSSAIYLSALSINDNLFLLLHLPQELHYAWYVYVLNVPVVCQAYGVLFLAVQYLSPFLVLSFTFDRFIAICYPFKKYCFCTTGTAIKMILLNIFVGFALSSIQGYFWTYNEVTEQCEVREDLSDETNGTSPWLKWTTVSESFVFLFIPSLNTLLNILVIHEIWKISGRINASSFASKPSFTTQTSHCSQQLSLQQRSSLASNVGGRHKTPQNQQLQPLASVGSNLNGNSHRQHHLMVRQSASDGNRGGSTAGFGCGGNSGGGAAPPGGSAAATNVMLLSVSFYVIFTTLPPAIIYSVENYFPSGNRTNTTLELIGEDPTWRKFITYMYVKTIVYELSLSHFACNVFLFAFTGRKFRNALSTTFGCRLWNSDVEEQSSYGPGGGGGGGGRGGSGWCLGPQDQSNSQSQQQTFLPPSRCKRSENNSTKATDMIPNI